MKSKTHEINSERFAYALGLFVIIMTEQSDIDELLFNEDVRTIFSAFKRRHLREVRLKNRTYECSVPANIFSCILHEEKDT